MNTKLAKTVVVSGVVVLGISNIVLINENIKLKGKLAGARAARSFVTRQFEHALDLVPTSNLSVFLDKMTEDVKFHNITKNL